MRAIGNKIIVEQLIPEQTEATKSGIYMPASNTAYKKCKVVSVGEGTPDHPMQVTVGKTVIISKSAGFEVTIDDKKYLVIDQAEVLVEL